MIIPNTVTKIGDKAFYSCKSLATVVVPSSVTEIGVSAFESCYQLQDIEIPDSVAKISERAFWISGKNPYSGGYYVRGKGLRTIVLPDSIVEIGDEAFSGCGLTSISMLPSLETIGSKAFYACENLKTVELSDSVQSIGDYAFYSSGVASISIPKTLKTVGRHVFDHCNNLKSITIPDSLTRIPDGLFYGCGIRSIEIPRSVKVIGNSVFANCSFLESIEIPENVVIIGDDAFSNCVSLREIVIPNSVTDIGKNLLSGCIELTKASLPNTVTDLSGCFSGCVSLKEVTIPDSVSQINGAFCGCKSLEEIIIPDSVTNIGDIGGYYADAESLGTFANCTSLKKIIIPESVVQIGNGSFYGCSGLESIVIPDSVVSIGTGAFSKCSNLNSIELPNSIQSIDYLAFEGCTSLKRIVLPDSLKEIKEYSVGSGLFENCINLRKLDFGKGIAEIPKNALYQLNLTDVIIWDNITSIYPGDFLTMDSLTIHGVEGSYAETFAKQYGFAFKSIVNEEIIPVERIQLQSDSLKLIIDKKAQITATVLPENATVKTISYSSKDPTIATVSSTGNVTGVSVGETEIIVKAGEVSEKVSVSVTNGKTTEVIYVEKITVDKKELALEEGDFVNVGAEAQPKDAENKKLIYVSTKPDVVSVDSSGNLTAKSEGQAEIIICSTDGSDVQTSVMVNVVKKEIIGTIQVSSIIVKESKMILEVGDTISCNAKVQPEDAENKVLKYVSTKPKIVYVDSYGSITALAAGQAEVVISATDDSGIQTSIMVTVVDEIIDVLNLDITPLSTVTYSGRAQTPAVTIRDGSYKLKKGEDYTATYKNNTDAGTASVIIKGTGKYKGSTTCKFLISKKKVSTCTFTIPKARVYTGSKLTPAITVKEGTKTLKKGTDYTVAYSNNINVGKATIKITGKGNYTGTATKTFKINPRGTSIKKVTAGTKAFTTAWTPQNTKMKTSYITGYQIQYSTSSSFASGNKIVTATKYSTSMKTVKSLAKGKKYYVRIRTYKTVGGVKYYSSWSASKAVTTK